jgi:hypothetical protein
VQRGFSVAQIRIDTNEVTVELAWWERPFGGGRSVLAVPLAAVLGADLVERPLSATTGGRSGLLVSGLLRIGRWGVGTGRRQFVSARRGVPAVRVRVDRAAAGRLGYDELLISTPDAVRVAATLPAPR